MRALLIWPGRNGPRPAPAPVGRSEGARGLLSGRRGFRWEAVRRRPRMLLATGALIVVYVLAHTVNTYALANGVGLGVPRTTMLSAVLIASAVNTPVVALIALLSDRAGRRPVCLAGGLAAIVWGPTRCWH